MTDWKAVADKHRERVTHWADQYHREYERANRAEAHVRYLEDVEVRALRQRAERAEEDAATVRRTHESITDAWIVWRDHMADCADCRLNAQYPDTPCDCAVCEIAVVLGVYERGCRP